MGAGICNQRGMLAVQVVCILEYILWYPGDLPGRLWKA
jgi:hypothetical protein